MALESLVPRESLLGLSNKTKESNKTKQRIGQVEISSGSLKIVKIHPEFLRREKNKTTNGIFDAVKSDFTQYLFSGLPTILIAALSSHDHLGILHYKLMCLE